MQLLSGSDQLYPMTTDNEFLAPRYLPLHQVVEYLVQADFVPETIEEIFRVGYPEGSVSSTGYSQQSCHFLWDGMGAFCFDTLTATCYNGQRIQTEKASASS